MARLALWEGLSDAGGIPDELARTELYAGKAEAMAAAQRADRRRHRAGPPGLPDHLPVELLIRGAADRPDVVRRRRRRRRGSRPPSGRRGRGRPADRHAARP
ncbi:hypothetical protein [Nonomuraea fuscirosea]|uniref:hypothetical protein n=1 Tax=Nonomuraea fuscirosea TaxID=1291556 RepID=UPI00342D4E01